MSGYTTLPGARAARRKLRAAILDLLQRSAAPLLPYDIHAKVQRLGTLAQVQSVCWNMQRDGVIEYAPGGGRPRPLRAVQQQALAAG